MKAILFTFLMFFSCLRMNAQIEQIASGATTGAVIGEITNGVNSIIGRAEAAGDFVLKRSSQEVLYILDAFKATNEDLLDKAFNNLSKERKAVLNKIIETTNSLESTVNITLDKAEQMLDQLNVLVRDVTFKKYPVIFRYRGGIVVPGSTQDVRITINGANLNRVARPVLEFRDEKYIANQLGESIFFELPKNIFNPNKEQFLSEIAQLKIEHKYGGFLGFFEKTKITSYDLNIITLPSDLGTAKLSFKEKIIEKKQKEFSGHVSHNSSSRSWDCRSFAYSPSTSSRRINPDKSWVRPHTGNSRGQLRDVSVKDTGISFRICCRRRWNSRNNGDRHVKYYYVEEWTETKLDDKTKSQSFDWLEDVVIKAGEDSKELVLELELFTGKKVSLTSSGKASKYVNVTFDNDSNLVIVKPVIPTDILRL